MTNAALYPSLLSLKSLPAPQVDLLYYDGPIDYIALVEEQPVLVTHRDIGVGASTDTWFLGPLSVSDIVPLMTGRVGIADAIRRSAAVVATRAGDHMKVEVATAAHFSETLPPDDLTYNFSYPAAFLAHRKLIGVKEPERGICFRLDSGDHGVAGPLIRAIVEHGRRLVAKSMERAAKDGSQLTKLARAASKRAHDAAERTARTILQQTEICVPPQNSVVLALVVRGDDSSQTSQFTQVGRATESLDGLVGVLTQDPPADTRLESSKADLEVMQHFMEAFADQDVSVDMFTFEHLPDQAPVSGVSGNLSPERAEVWGDRIRSYRQAPAGQAQVLRLRGVFRQIADLRGCTFQFQPDGDQSVDEPIKGKIETDEVAEKFVGLTTETPVVCRFEKRQLRGKKKPSFTLLGIRPDRKSAGLLR